MSSGLIEGHNLTRWFPFRQGFSGTGHIRAVTDVSITVARGEAVGLVGESGSGKSTIGRLMLGLQPLTSGRVVFDGKDLADAKGRGRKQLRRRMQLVFQDPYSSLDPRRDVGAQIGDGLTIHHIGTPQLRRERVEELLIQVGLDPSVARRYPDQFSGGQRQRLAIARALATDPEFLVADEPVSALDVSVQAQVLRVLSDLQRRLGLAMLFISHDLAVVRHVCDRVIVLYLGQIMEQGPTSQVFSDPRHPYTRALLSATPSFEPNWLARRQRLGGEPPSPAALPKGCVFNTRCPLATDACRQGPIASVDFGGGHSAACIHTDRV